jgi:KUP system potassium uptake protein
MSTTTTIASPAAGEESPGEHNGHNGNRWKVLALGALGVVYGDIGTSPLYALRECFHGEHEHVLAVTRLNVFGVLSLIFWSLTLIISIKYLIFILRADNQGEGGILALMALLTPRQKGVPKRAIVIALGLLGAAFLYADGMITPAITVLSAIEGVEIAAPGLQHFVVPIAVVILIALFWLQSRGTARVGALFGPVMLVWFVTLAALGVWHIAKMPGVFAAINPMYGWEFFQHNGWHGFAILGTVFLVVTGGEALYADIGHFGVFPIRVTWYSVVFPALLLNYFGQGSLLLRDSSAEVNPLYHMVDGWILYPLIGLATLAAVMASQAVITGSFSLTLQAIQLGYCPRLRIEHTSSEQFGQIYIPAINRALMVASIALVLGFGSSSKLAAAYGLAITFTMVVTTTLFFLLIKDRWRWHPIIAVLFAVLFLTMDLAFFGANLLKVLHGGWFPLLIAAIIYIMMTTWRDGRQLLAARLRASMLSTELFIADLMSNPLLRVPGTAVFMSGNPMGTPLALRQNVAHNHVLHECNIILGVQTAEVPHVDEGHRVESEEIGEGFFRVSLNYGFMEEPNVPRDLTPAACLGHDVKLAQVSYFLGRETLIATATPGMALWRESLFAFLSRNSQPATLFFHLPPDRVVEIGAQVEL